ncbi:hypothetical protein TUM4438_10610 [Shewanella sairae]|uniref:Type 4b pilus protein PilO2 n=1 Tax=Shewanella sairae TaxID=190310 RepID=A0ABQ4P5Y2_9GAMM|nr:hypothetical protein [Shewanella sairae]MCL1130494.1 hypothetical protein [Shewanella sairae]GIU42915.1 hypothetical protein TUM4438_10610 [Shewanella sairae]
MSSLTVPTFYTGASKSISRRELCKRYPAPFNYTVERNGWICHYTSEVPAFAVAEAWVARVDKKVESILSQPQSWSVLSLVDEQILFVSVYQGVVQKAYLCSGADLQAENITLLRSEQVFITDDSLMELLPSDCSYQLVTPLSDDELALFALKKQGSPWPLVIAGGVIASAIGGWFLYAPTPPPPPPPQVVEVVIDPYDAYRDALSNAIEASSVLNNAKQLGAYAALLPSEWPLNNIEFLHNKLSLNIARSTTAKRSLLTTWLNLQPQLTQPGMHQRLQDDLFVLSADSPVTLSRWQGSMASTQSIRTPLQDALIALGWEYQSNSSYAQTMTSVFSSTLSMRKTEATLTELGYVAELVAEVPVSIDSLSMKPTSNGRYAIDLSIRVFGTTKDE